MTLNQNYREILLTVHASYFSGTLGIQFMGETTYISLTSPSSNNCKTNLQYSGQIGTVGCTYAYVSSSIMTFDIIFYTWPTQPKQNNLHSHDGNPLVSDFFCDISQANSGVYCVFKDVINYGVRGEKIMFLFYFLLYLIIVLFFYY